MSHETSQEPYVFITQLLSIGLILSYLLLWQHWCFFGWPLWARWLHSDNMNTFSMWSCKIKVDEVHSLTLMYQNLEIPGFDIPPVCRDGNDILINLIYRYIFIFRCTIYPCILIRFNMCNVCHKNMVIIQKTGLSFFFFFF